MLDTLINKYLPDFTKKKISKEEALKLLKVVHSVVVGKQLETF